MSKGSKQAEQIYRAHTCLIESIYRGEAKFLNFLNNLGNLLCQCCTQDSETLKIQQTNKCYGLFGFFYPIIVICDEDLCSSDPDLLRRFISPDYERISRVQKHLDTEEYLAERFGELIVHASWEGTILHGKVDPCEVTNHDILSRFIHHVWFSAYLLDRLASIYLDDANKIASSGFRDLSQRINDLDQLLSKIRTLRRRYVLIKNRLLDFTATANMNMRFIELLKYGYEFSNMDFLLKSAEEKLNILHNDHSMLYQQLEQRRIENQQQANELINFKLNLFMAVFVILGSIPIIDIFFGLIEGGSLGTPFGRARMFFEALPILVAVGYYFYWKRMHSIKYRMEREQHLSTTLIHPIYKLKAIQEFRSTFWFLVYYILDMLLYKLCRLLARPLPNAEKIAQWRMIKVGNRYYKLNVLLDLIRFHMKIGNIHSHITHLVNASPQKYASASASYA
jgi:hypothetical protein